VRLPGQHFLRSQELQQETERLLGDVFLRKCGLIPHDAADRAMQHRDKRENEETLDEWRPGGAHPEQFAQQFIGAYVRGRSPQGREKIGNG
jgi:hypothetical protein